MRACSWANSDAIALSAFELLGRPLPVAELDEPEQPVVTSPDSIGTTAIDVAGIVAAFLDGLLVVVGRGFGPKDEDFLRGLGGGEDRIGVGEVHDAERVGVGYVGSNRPLCDEPRRVDVVVVVPQEADVDPEVADEVGQDALTDRGRGSRVHRHQFGCDGGDDFVEGTSHVCSGVCGYAMRLLIAAARR